jgi:5,10-methylenetetrahydromethanopterin reductase
MRIGVTLIEESTPDALDRITDQMRQAADDGLDSAWMSHIFGLDSLTALAAAGSRVPGIEFGTAVIPTYPRHPAALAQQAMTTALAVQGRLTLGIGLSHKVVIEDMFGYDFARPARHMDEYLSVLLPLLNGEQASFTGETVRAQIGLSTPRPGRVPVLVAALGPRMLRLAGERADGTVLWMTGPATIRDHIVPTITAAADGAGRPAPRVVCSLPFCVSNDSDTARELAAHLFEIYGSLPSYRAMMDREGVEGPADLAIIGDEDAVTARVAELAEAGVTDFVAVEYSRPDAARTRACLKSLKIP